MKQLTSMRTAIIVLMLGMMAMIEGGHDVPLPRAAGEDLSLNPLVFESDSLPAERERCSVANGQLATIVYSDTVYMNGLYNGQRGNSHRARIPSRINIRFNQTSSLEQRYILDTQSGTFIERAVINGVPVEQKTFAHRSITSLLITQISADLSALDASTTLTLNLSNDPGIEMSDDIYFSTAVDYTRGPGKQQIGVTKIVENAQYQSDTSSVAVIYSDVPEEVTLTESEPMITFIMAVATDYTEASFIYSQALSMSGDELYQSHVDKWNTIWESGNILLEGPNLELAKVVRGSMYYLLSSLPNEPIDEKRQRFSGLSPGSLAYGSYLKDYQGHSFWDTETWMYPPVLMLWSYVAKDLLLYRMRNIESARDRAISTGYRGARFPWESGFTGAEVTPDCCPETRDNQQHITADISFAARQYWAATGDRNWLNGENYNFPVLVNGCNFIRELAEFWASRAEYEDVTRQYEINGVMPPDEDHGYVNNSVYTNVLASYSIFFAKHAECECGQHMTSGSIPDEWLEIARQLKVPYDEDLKYHPEYDGYELGEKIKQADVVLLGFPIMYVKDPTDRKNDLQFYENVTRENGPAMTWSMHAIGHLEIGEESRAEELLNRSYQPYLVEPFKVWNEAMDQQGAFNFITGMGGFLQSILFGYGGFRLTVEKLEGNPKLPPGITKFSIVGLDYLNCSINFAIEEATIKIDLYGDSCSDIELVTDDGKSSSSGNVTIPRQAFHLKRKIPLSCPLPEDLPGQIGSIPTASTVPPDGENHSATLIHSSLQLLIALLAITILYL